MSAKTKVMVVAGALAGLAAFSSGAQAGVYDFSFVADTLDSSDANYGPLSIVGDLYTAGSALPADVTGIAGYVTGDAAYGIASGTITGLSPYADADNILYGTGTSGQVSLAGFSFSVVGGQAFNIYSYTGGNYALASVVDSTGYAWNGVVGALTVTAIPELSIWAMLLVGFAGLGFAGYRSSRKRMGLAA